MRSRLVPGLRERMIAALVVTSAVTLAVAAVALLHPLERRLRHEEVRSLLATASASRPTFQDLPAEVLRPGSASLLRLARGLDRRTGARVVIRDSSGRTLADTRPELPLAAAPQTSGRPTGRVVASSSAADEAQVTVPFAAAHRRYVLALRKPLDDVSAAARDVRRAFTAAALAGLGIALLVGAGVAAYLVRRLRRLRDVTLEVAARGPEAPLPAVAGRDEVGDLARAFATMQRRLRRQEDARREFVATASHELRTPLASLRTMLELLGQELEAGAPDVERVREQVGEAEAQSRRLAALASDLLDLTRLDADVELRSEPVELAEVCRAVAAELEGERAPRVRVELPAEPCWALGDPGATAHIARILIDNALRYSPPGSVVAVSVSCDDHNAQMRVDDSGPGVPDDERELIFERFRRGRRTSGEPGFGLGLAIGRGLARRMGGEVTLERSEPGATFALRLPAAVEALVDLPAVV